MSIDARLFEQCRAVYAAMYADSQVKTVKISSNEGPLRVYVGFTTYLFEGIGLTISNYTPVMRRLQGMGCVKQLVRGGRGIPSEWVLIEEPTPRSFTRSGQRWLRDRDRIEELEQRVDDLEAMLTQKASLGA
jgi:hypothetical protein